MPEYVYGVLVGQLSMVVAWWGAGKYVQYKQRRNNRRVGRAIDNPLGG